jgi:mono/diheme cytochrome c family protein
MRSAIKLLLLSLLALQPDISRAAKTVDSETMLRQAPARAQARKNPYANSSEARMAGRKLFQRHCAECHGEDGGGTLDAPPLQTGFIRTAPPGALVWFLKNGNLRRGMPSWSRLPEEQLWQIVTYLLGVEEIDGGASHRPRFVRAFVQKADSNLSTHGNCLCAGINSYSFPFNPDFYIWR